MAKSTKRTGVVRAKRKANARRIVQHAAKLAAQELAEADGHRLEDPEADGDEEPSVRNAPPLPGNPAAEDKPSPVPEWAKKLGDVPEDPLAAQYWLYRANALSAQGALLDDKISEATRRKELRTISASAARLMPDARRWEATQMIIRDRAELEAKASERRGAKLEQRPKPAPKPKPAPDDDFGGDP